MSISNVDKPHLTVPSSTDNQPNKEKLSGSTVLTSATSTTYKDTTPCKPHEVITRLPNAEPNEVTNQPAPQTEEDSIPQVSASTTEATSGATSGGVLRILSDLSAVFSVATPATTTTDDTGVVLVTPTKKIVALVKSPNKPKSPKQQKIAAAPHRTPGEGMDWCYGQC
mgnify:FL=1